MKTNALKVVSQQPRSSQATSNFLLKAHRKLAYSTKENIVIINFDDIHYVKSESNYTLIQLLSGKSHLITKTLKSTCEKLDHTFLRIHQSYVINLLEVEGFNYNTGQVLLSKERKLPVSRSRRQYLKSLLLMNKYL